MKLNVEIEIDWLDEEYNLDDTIKQDIIASLTRTIKSGMKDNIKRKVNSRVSVKVDEWIMEQLHLFCDRRIEITDKWGDTKEHHESVTEMFKSKFDNFFNASVNKDGKSLKSCSYGDRTTRIDHMLEKKAKEHLVLITKDMDYRIKKSIDKATKEKIEEKIKKHVLEKVGDLVYD